MPEHPWPKLKAHPSHVSTGPRTSGPAPCVRYAELLVTSNFTFLTGASHPDEFVEHAALLGHHAIAITDTNTLAGIVRAQAAAKDAGLPLVVGCRLVFTEPDAPNVCVYPTSRPAYARLCRLLTRGKRRAPKGECHLQFNDLLEGNAGLLAIIAPCWFVRSDNEHMLHALRSAFDDDRLSLATAHRYHQDDAERHAHAHELAKRCNVPLVVTNDVLYHIPERRMLQDTVTCIRQGCTIEQAGLRLQVNAERHLKTPDEMARLFADAPEAIARTVEVADRALAFDLDELKYEYPVEPCPDGMTPFGYLKACVDTGSRRRYPDGVPTKVSQSLEHELALIKELRYEAYFLTCYDIVNFARSHGILCQGRGGAANSAVCFCLGITEVDPARFSLLFERFVSRARNEPPDIDIDFEHERREEVIQHIYQKYGRERAALTAEVISYRGRSAVREVGKAMGLSLDCVDALAKNLDRWHAPPTESSFADAGVNGQDPTIRQVVALTKQLAGFPRHLSQHVGGFVITRTALHDLVPIENAAMEDRTVIEWDKDDIDAMGILKVDCLGLGMLTCIRKAFTFVKQIMGEELTLHKVLHDYGEDPAVYEMIQHADTVGVFQIESRAQMSMLPRLKPANFYDLVIEVAIVRPGPIQGGMVHPYLRRRTGEEAVVFPSEAVRDVLGRTLGVPLFQEQAMQLAIVAAGFTPDEADGLRRAMAAWRRKGDKIAAFGRRLITGMVANGYERDFAERCFAQIKGFSEYGFPESHAASFALLVYVSCWLKRYHPALFAAALINSQPMGFYAPAQIVRDAREHGVDVLPVDVNDSAWDCSLEVNAGARTRAIATAEPGAWGKDGPALRLGLRMVRGLPEQDAERLVAARKQWERFETIEQLWRRSGISTRALRALAKADAFRSMGVDRRAASWQIGPLRDVPLPLFEEHIAQPSDDDQRAIARLPSLPLRKHVLGDYEAVGLSLKAHPMFFMRERFERDGVIRTTDLRDASQCPQGRRVAVAGVVLMRQRPSTASGVVFITLEDETGIANLILWKDIFERFRKIARLSSVMLAQGRVERQGEVVHVHADRLVSLDESMPEFAARSRDFH
ncbi:MAG: error-prone DNA polymerase [Phycisphaerales bacterium]|nr:error-prone DNA polymerase [Phycisphaerales bacterium]